MITIYSTPTCGSCKALKSYCSIHNIEFKEVDLADVTREELEAIIEKFETISVPILEFEDGDVIKGFNLERIESKLHEIGLISKD